MPAGCRFHPRCPMVIDICRHEAPLLRGIGPDHFSKCHRAEAMLEAAA
jgi:oligopeptide/dipeptide ABC transporter ATP-binding protein